MARRGPGRIWWGIGAASCLLVALALLYEGWVSRHRLSVIPESWGISTILYAKEESWGFGPGGNESGLVTYELPKDTRTNIQDQGILYLRMHASVQSGDDIRRVYSEWNETPVSGRDWVCAGSECAIPGVPAVENFLSRYGFGVALPADVAKEVNSAIAHPGAYYSYGRAGVLLVVPSRSRVYFLFSG